MKLRQTLAATILSGLIIIIINQSIISSVRCGRCSNPHLTDRETYVQAPFSTADFPFVTRLIMFSANHGSQYLLPYGFISLHATF